MTWAAAALNPIPSTPFPKPWCYSDTKIHPTHCNTVSSKTFSVIQSGRKASPTPFLGRRFSNNSPARSCRFGRPKSAIVPQSYCPNRRRALQESPRSGGIGSGRPSWSRKPKTRLRFHVSPSGFRKWKSQIPCAGRQIWIDCQFVSRQACFYATKLRIMAWLSCKKSNFAVWI